jgi:hypothetical protein
MDDHIGSCSGAGEGKASSDAAGGTGDEGGFAAQRFFGHVEILLHSYSAKIKQELSPS